MTEYTPLPTIKSIKVRRRPLVFSAYQFQPDPKWPVDTPHAPGVSGDYHYRFPGDAYWFIDTLEGQMNVQPGDWIVTGIAGEHWAVKPDIFWQTYEAVEEL